jgi:hypothetical protein
MTLSAFTTCFVPACLLASGTTAVAQVAPVSPSTPPASMAQPAGVAGVEKIIRAPMLPPLPVLDWDLDVDLDLDLDFELMADEFIALTDPLIEGPMPVWAIEEPFSPPDQLAMALAFEQAPVPPTPPAQPAPPSPRASDIRKRTKIAAKTIEGVKPLRLCHPERGPKPGGVPAAEAVDPDLLYECGRRALDRAEWDNALRYFSRVPTTPGAPRAAGAIYWRAYAQNKLGQRAEALSTLSALEAHPARGGWANEAKALEIEIRQSSGQRVSPETGADEDLKLLALQGLANSDADTAVPLIEGLLTGAQAPRLKERALFVLAHSSNPAARNVVVRVAKGNVNPDLQLKALQYVGLTRTPEAAKILGDVYTSTSEVPIKRAILRGYGHLGDRERLLAAATKESTPELRLEAVRQLGNLKAGSELSALYGRESSPEVKKQILRGLAMSAQTDKVFDLIQSEQDAELRRTGLRSLGVSREPTVAPQLVSLYGRWQEPELREAIVDALCSQDNAAALVTLARQEKDPALKKTIVRRLSSMHSKEATDYLLELLK